MDAEKRRTMREYAIDGTAARKLMVVPDYERERQNQEQPVRNQEKAPSIKNGIDFISMSLLVIALAITLYLCYNYLQVQGNIIQLERDIKLAEQDLNGKISENAALEESLNTETNWDKVYQVAIGKLHMVYPNKNEVIPYQSSEEGYVIQYRNIPE